MKKFSSIEVEVYGANYDELLERALEKAESYWPTTPVHKLYIEPFQATPATETMASVESWRANIVVYIDKQ
jgi:hypothetical protein